MNFDVKIMKRLVFIDNLKLNLIILVILHHIVIVYGASGGFPIIEGATDSISPIIFTVFTAINQSFFMALFFLLSGYFLVGSLARKGTGTYVKDRLIRLGIPLVGYVLLVAPVVDYLVLKSRGQAVPLLSLFHLNWDVGPMWFVEGLLILSLVYLFVKPKLNIFKNKFPTNKAITISILVLAILTFMVRIFFPVDTYVHVFQPGHWINYIFAFYIGTIAYNNNWFEHLKNKQSKVWKRVALGNIIALPIMMGITIALIGQDVTPFLGGFGWVSLLFSFWDTIGMISIIISLLFIFKDRFNSENKITKFLSPNYYGAYIFHTVIILFIMVPLMKFAIPSILKALIVALITVPVSFGFTYLIRKIPFVRRVI